MVAAKSNVGDVIYFNLRLNLPSKAECATKTFQLCPFSHSQVLRPLHAPNCYHKLGARARTGCIRKGLFSSFFFQQSTVGLIPVLYGILFRVQNPLLLAHMPLRSQVGCFILVTCKSKPTNIREFSLFCFHPSLRHVTTNKLPLRSLPLSNLEFPEPKSLEMLRKLVVY